MSVQSSLPIKSSDFVNILVAVDTLPEQVFVLPRSMFAETGTGKQLIY